MRPSIFVLALAGAVGVPSLALAQAAANTHEGHVVVRTEAAFGGFMSPIFGSTPDPNPGLGAGLATGLDGPTNFVGAVSIRPSADYFLTDHITIGAGVDFSLLNIPIGGLVNVQVIGLGVMPRVGYSYVLLDKVSVWPSLGVGLGVAITSAGGPSETDVRVPIDLFLPFYFHPKDNFFVGIGPGLLVQAVKNGSFMSIDPLRFTLGGDII